MMTSFIYDISTFNINNEKNELCYRDDDDDELWWWRVDKVGMDKLEGR